MSAYSQRPRPPPPPEIEPGIGTGLTPGFGEILKNWDNVLKALDKVNAYTAERANESAARLAESCKAERPTLLGETPEGCEWQAHSRAKPPQEGVSSFEWPSLTLSAAEGGSSSSTSAGAGKAAKGHSLGEPALARWEVHFARKADWALHAEIFVEWRQSVAHGRAATSDEAFEALETAMQSAKGLSEDLQNQLSAEQELAARLRLARSVRCKQALSYFQQASVQEMARACFDVWHAEQSSAASSTGTLRKAEDADAELRTKDTELDRLQGELELRSQRQQVADEQLASSVATSTAAAEALRVSQQEANAAAEEAAEAKGQLRSNTEALGEATSQLNSAQAELTDLKRQLGAMNQEVLHLRASSSQDAAAAARKDLGELSLQLARSQADTAEARTEARRHRSDAERLQAAFAHGRKELEIVYGVLNGLEGSHQDTVKNLKGALRDREAAVAHLHHILEQFREPLAPIASDEDLIRRSSTQLQASRSVPSLSSQARGPAPKSRAIAKDWEDQKRRFSAGWH